MSVDYYIYVKDTNHFSIKQCEDYVKSLGLSVEFYPNFNIYTHTGFLPIRLDGLFISDSLAGKSFLSGFETQLDQYEYCPPEKESKGLLNKFFRKNTAKQETTFDNAIKESSHCFYIHCGTQDELPPNFGPAAMLVFG